MSKEEPSLVVSPLENNQFIGGAGIVSSHAVGLKSKVHFISVVGNDLTRKFAIKKLKEYKVNSTLFVDKSRPTTLKQRFQVNNN